MTGLNEAEESRNEDLDFEEKNKWKFIKSEIKSETKRDIIRGINKKRSFKEKQR